MYLCKDVEDGKKKIRKCFADVFLELVLEMGSKKAHYWKLSTQNSIFICKNWKLKLNHNLDESKLCLMLKK